MSVMSQRTCDECGSTDLVTITMEVGDQELSFTACHNCEAKWWYKSGELVPLTSVLGLVGAR